MTDRVTTLLAGRRERMERVVGRALPDPQGDGTTLTSEAREFLLDEAQDLYWNELEWENITDEERMEEGLLTELAFPGFLAFIRGLLLTKVMPDALAPAQPRPQVVDDVLGFLAGRVVELEDGLADADEADTPRLRAELDMTSRLIDLVLYLYHGLGPHDVERVEGARRSVLM